MSARTSTIDVLLDIGALLGSATAQDEATADELLGLVHGVVPYAAASLSAFDPVDGRHRTLARTGYSDRAVEHLDTWFVAHDAVYHHMRSVDPTPLRWQDMPFDYREMYSAREVFLPHGFREGMTICLYTRGERRYTGNLHLSTDEPTFPGDADDMARLQHLLGGFLDRLRPGLRHLHAAGPDARAALVGPDGCATPVGDHEPGPHLAAGGALAVAVADARRRGALPPRFRWQDATGGWHRVHTVAAGAGVLVIETRCPLPHGLSGRELDVLTGLCAGRTNPEIAADLVVSTKTVAKHVEHVLEKLGCRSRTAAAVRAASHGLVALPVGRPPAR
jgi:DNA-binding CsgD family transcriptional regulator